MKEPKLYFFDTGLVKGNEGAKFENLVALSLLAYTYDQEDLLGKKTALHYVRTKEAKEVDFCIVKDSEIASLIEVKHKKSTISKNLLYFQNKLDVPAI